MTAETSYGSGYSAGDPVEAGLERARQHGIDVARADLEAPLSALRYVLDTNWRNELSERFVELLTENVTVASAARRFYGDSALDAAAIEGFVEHSVGFFNSWRHR